MIEVTIGGTPHRLEDRDLLGAGGEAQVFALGARAVKIFHPVPSGIQGRDRKRLEAMHRMRAEKLETFPAGLPSTVVAPRELVHDRAGRLAGYVMDRVDGGYELGQLASRSFREGSVDSASVMALFRRIQQVVLELHRKSVIIGDFNDANVLVVTPYASGELEPRFIDVDSMQAGPHPCPVGHERFLDPRLLGVDLAAAPAFRPENDWYAFGVLLFQSLLYVHPYGGVHPKLPTMLRRAEARVSVMRPEVKYPKAALPFALLTDELLAWLEPLFDGDRREPVPPAALEASWTRCGCGLEHARRRCPACSRQVPVQAPVTHRGRCRARTIFSTRGRILGAVIQRELKYVYEEGGTVRREDRSRVMEGTIEPGTRFAIAGRATWIGKGGRLIRIEDEKVQERLSTGSSSGVSIFGTAAAALYRLDDDWIVDHPGGNRLGRILPGQTRLEVGEGWGAGYYRAGGLIHFFMFRVGRPGLTRIEAPRIEGRIREVAFHADDRHLLVTVASETHGSPVHTMWLVGHDGKLVACLTGSPGDVRMLASIHGKALSHGRVVTVTHEGLLSLEVEPAGKTFREGTLFEDTGPFVEVGDRLLPGPGGSIYTVSASVITQLELA